MQVSKVLQGNCLEILPTLPDNSVDSIVTDPPYELGFMGKSWDNTGIANNVEMWKECLRVLKPGGYLLSFGGTRTYHRMASAIEDTGFEVRDMIEFCYGSGFPKSLNVWKQLKKNCTCGNMEVYEKRIQLQQTLGEAETEYELRLMSETDLSQEINPTEEQGEVLQSELSEQGLEIQQPKPTKNVREGQSSLEGRDNVKTNSRELSGNDLCEMSKEISADGEERRIHNATQISDGSTPEPTISESGSSASQRSQPEKQQYREPCSFCKQYGTQAIRTFGIGTALKPAHEPICMARKPLAEKTVAENCLKYGTGGINIDESRVDVDRENEPRLYDEEGASGMNCGDSGFGNNLRKSTDFMTQGRFPANLVHDNSEEVRECFPESKAGASIGSHLERKGKIRIHASKDFGDGYESYGDSGNASRFFKSIIYTAKASKGERNRGCEGLELREIYPQNNSLERKELNATANKRVQNNHPTVKPIAIMEYLIKMVTPQGGIVLDPFAGSGSTLVAAKRNGFGYIGIEMEAEYVKIAEARLNAEPDRLIYYID